MLARLEAIDGVAIARTEATGRHFLLELDPGSVADAVQARALESLGGDSHRLELDAEEDQVGGFLEGELWMSPEELLKLSLIEARILARRHALDAAKSAGLDAEQESKLEELVRQELFSEFEAVHERGGSEDRVWYKPAFRAAFDRACVRARAFLSGDQAIKAMDAMAAEYRE